MSSKCDGRYFLYSTTVLLEFTTVYDNNICTTYKMWWPHSNNNQRWKNTRIKLFKDKNEFV